MMRTVTLVSVLVTAGCLPSQEGHWQLDETTGTTARDASPNGNDGTLRNFGPSPWGPGRFGNALSFDGVDDYVEIVPRAGLPAFDGRGSPYSVAFWVRGGPQEDRRVYAECNGTGNNNPMFTLGTGRVSLQTGDRLHVFLRNDAGRVVVNASSLTSVFDNQWHHVAWIDVAGAAALYIDGVKDGRNYDYTSTNAVGGRGTQTRDFGTFTMTNAAIGAVLRRTSCCWYQGEIDDVRVYGFALDPADLTVLIAAAPPGFPACTASVGKFGHGCGSALDISGTGTARFGGQLSLQLTAGTPGSPALLLLGTPVTPLDLSLAGFPGCVLYPSLAGSVLANLGVLDPAGASRVVTVTIPNTPAAACAIGAVQGVAITGNALELTGVVLAQLGR